MLALLLAAAAPQIAPPAATWMVAGAPGAVISVTGRVKTGGRIVADRFVTDATAVREERGSLAQTPDRRGTCAWAAAVRPFTRLRRFAASGRLLWEWHADRQQQAVQLYATGAGDCLSPNGGRLTVTTWRVMPREPLTALGNAVVAVDHRPRFVRVDAIARREADVAGWRAGKPATLMVEVDGAAKQEVVVP